MTFKEALLHIEGLRTVVDEMDILSAPGRYLLMQTEFLTDPGSLEKVYEDLSVATAFVSDKENSAKLRTIESLLINARDISSTLSRLESGSTPDEVELFEIKGLAVTVCRLSEACLDTELNEIDTLRLPDLREIVSILDPEKTQNTHFHIYDAYSPRLASIRKALRKVQAEDTYDEEESSRLTVACMEIEEEIREELGTKLRPYAGILSVALKALGATDIILAKAKLNLSLRLSRPQLSKNESVFCGLSYIPIAISLKNQGRSFQPVDISLRRGATLITGANMGGKTVTLRSVALAQAMAQYGFFVASRSASIRPVLDILQSIGDVQSSVKGLSSFGAEILNLDTIIRKANDGGPYLILIDEPARTTNPEEGEAIAGAVTSILNETESMSLLTTHYGNIECSCRRIRVKGLKNLKSREEGFTIKKLGEMMDYSLIPVDGYTVDREALNIARLLGIEEGFAQQIEKTLKKL